VNRVAIAVACALVACAGPDAPAPANPAPTPLDAQVSTSVAKPAVDAAIDAPTDAPIDAPPVALAPEEWLKGSTHVHAKPSGDSTEPIPQVIRWYEDHHYDFIVLTDHNRVSEVDPAMTTAGLVTVSPSSAGLIVLSGIELTHNPSDCIPAGDASRKCRIHVNLLGPTGRPSGKIVWANRQTHDRLPKYEAAVAEQKLLGGFLQLNHPQWYWGMNADLLAQLAQRGFSLVEIANAQFAKWNAGDKDHPSMEALWDAALAKGVTLWGVASDDAHDYGPTRGKYPAGGGWVVVKARRDPQAILDALAAGHFYASTGVVLETAEVDAGELVVTVAPGEPGTYTIDFIENGKRVQRVRGRTARHAVPASGYVRALVTRDDGKLAWIQPARR
jgi:hypothetical protein